MISYQKKKKKDPLHLSAYDFQAQFKIVFLAAISQKSQTNPWMET